MEQDGSVWSRKALRELEWEASESRRLLFVGTCLEVGASLRLCESGCTCCPQVLRNDSAQLAAG